MAKKGMKRPDITQKKTRNEASMVPLIQGKAKYGNEHANPIIAGTHAPALKVYHSTPHGTVSADKPVPDIYPAIDTDLARDNIENDLTAADLQDL
ncbi:MAG: hypothetical protein ACI4I9_08610 [Porcipelethomonas sp.]